MQSTAASGRAACWRAVCLRLLLAVTALAHAAGRRSTGPCRPAGRGAGRGLALRRRGRRVGRRRAQPAADHRRPRSPPATARRVELRIGSTTLLLGSQRRARSCCAWTTSACSCICTAAAGRCGCAPTRSLPSWSWRTRGALPAAPRRAVPHRPPGRAQLPPCRRGELRVDAPQPALTLYPGQRAEFWRDGHAGDTRSQSLDRSATTSRWRCRPASRPTRAAPRRRYVLARDDRRRRPRPLWPLAAAPRVRCGLECRSVVAAGWAPYRYGRWAWVRPWGWTWVDDAPWGFAPFHYGRWVCGRGERWCWAPGADGGAVRCMRQRWWAGSAGRSLQCGRRQPSVPGGGLGAAGAARGRTVPPLPRQPGLRAQRDRSRM